VAAGRVRLAADLAIPAAAKGVVLFAHGSGSGRLSPRNRLVPPRSSRRAWPPCCWIC
jgi:putative phosphoribosyl transferase